MHDTTALGRALSPVELSHARYLDAISTFRTSTGLCMTQGAGEGGEGGEGGQGGAAQGGASGGQGGAQSQGGNQGPEMAVDSQGRSLGFPKNTPVADMTDAEGKAYYKNLAEKHEGRYKNLAGERSFDDTKKALEEYERIQREQMTPSEKALAEARDEAKSEGLKAARAESATAVFKGALQAGGLTGDDLNELVANFNVANYVGENGVDTDKVVAFAKRFTPSDKDNLQRRRDFGGGHRQEGLPARGAAGRAEAEKRGFIKPAANQTTS